MEDHPKARDSNHMERELVFLKNLLDLDKIYNRSHWTKTKKMVHMQENKSNDIFLDLCIV